MPSLKRNHEAVLTALLDILVLLLVWLVFVWFVCPDCLFVFSSGELLSGLAFALHTAYWLAVFMVMGLYKKLYLISRFDEFIKVLKGVFIGSLLLFFGVSLLHSTAGPLVSPTIAYFVLVTSFVSFNRFVIRSIQRMYALKGKGLHRAAIIGTGETAWTVYENLNRNRTLGLQVVGFVNSNGTYKDSWEAIDQDSVIANVETIDQSIEELSIQELIIALEPEQRAELIHVLGCINHPDVSIKILPDFHQLVMGLNKTNQIFGMPLIEISPDVMPFWEKLTKRVMDIVVSLVGLIVLSPLILSIYIAVRSTSEGPGVYVQKRVGKNGKVFAMFKFRTMYNNAEKETGPTWATENDPRVTPLGKWLRKLRLDELPQLWNVLKGEMSLVGPRPERPHFVKQFRREIPLYSRRLRVKPGITGWAQVKWKYDSTLDDVVEKTKYDLFYVENMSLRMDFKILFNTLFSIIRAKGR
ncbi:MAG: sugar transferase [Balneolaceae bacterium]